MEDKSKRLLEDINIMLSSRERGYTVAQKLNDEFWEELGTHRERLLEQVNTPNQGKPSLDVNSSNADSIYEAARNFLDRYRTQINSK